MLNLAAINPFKLVALLLFNFQSADSKGLSEQALREKDD